MIETAFDNLGQDVRRRLVRLAIMLVFLFHAGWDSYAASSAANEGSGIELSEAVVVCPADLSGPEKKAIDMLVEEVEKRTLVRWNVRHAWPTDSVPVIAVGPMPSVRKLAASFAEEISSTPEPTAAEGYRLRVIADLHPAPAVFVLGADARGVLFGVGRVLREMRMGRGTIYLADSLDISAAPKYPLRGHQLGYRPKTNSYDAWTIGMWEQYIRDLAVFGVNAVELIPPRSDDAADSPHFPRPPMDMMTRMSQLLDDYGLDVWIWYPALDADYSDPDTVAFAMEEWGDVFRKLPRIDAVFVPGGDPGHTRPKHLLALLEKQTAMLKRYHPDAEMWMSPQSFTQEWMNEFLVIIQTEQPTWLSGIVFGPQNRVSLPALRAAVPKQYPIRRYPDITHSLMCQYPVPDWDVAYAMTENREPINPRPVGYARIFQLWADDSIGFITYSEGCNDDVNKIVWSCLAWDSRMPVVDILRQYVRYFIGEPYEEDLAQGILALERNWEGPLLTNESVFTTLKQFQAIEKSASPQVLLNWRFQQMLYRAYYDAYTKRRLLYETELEEQAMDILRQADARGSLKALDDAEAILDQAVAQRVAADLRARIFELAEALYQSIRMQLSVPRYKAISIRRGANLDLVDNQLNNKNWLEQRFSEVRALPDEAARLQGIEEIVGWTNPGPGGFYDDLGNVTRQPHLVRGTGQLADPEFRATSQLSTVFEPSRRISWVSHGESHYDAPLIMRYDNLDPQARYKVRAVYAGDNFETRLQLLADDEFEVHPFIGKKRPLQPVEFEIPPEANADGKLTLTWRQEPGHGGAGRGCQVAEVWLVRATGD